MDLTGIEGAVDKIDAKTLPELLAGVNLLLTRLNTETLPALTSAAQSVAGTIQTGVLADLDTALTRLEKLLKSLDGATITTTVKLAPPA